MLASCTDEQIEASTRPDDFFCTREAQWSAGNPVSLKLGLQAALNTQLHSFFSCSWLSVMSVRRDITNVVITSGQLWL